MAAGGGGGGIDATVGGNSTSAGAGYILVSSGTMTLAGGPNVTLSQDGNAISISAAAGGGGTQTAISGISVSNTDYTSGTVEIVGSGGGITVGSAAGQKVVLSVASTVSQTKQTSDVIDLTLAGNTAGALALMSSGTVTLAGGQGITLSQAGNAVTISGSTFSQSSQPQSNQAGSVYASSNTFGTSSGTYDARSISIAGRGAVSVAASNSGWIISAPAQSVQPAQTGISGISASNTVYTSGTVALTGVGGGVTVSSNTGQRVDISVAAPVAQSVQTQSRFDMTLAGNSTSAGAGFIEMSSGTVTLAGGNNITISQNGNALTISGPNVGGAQTGISGIVASDATYTSGTVTFTGVGGGITVSSNTGQRIDLSVAAQTNQAGSVYASSNTFGTSSGTFDARTLSIAGSGAVSVAASNSGWVISAPAQSVQPQTNQAGSVYASSNTFGTSSGTYDARTLSIAGVGAVQVAASNSGWRISAPVQTNQAGSVYASSNTFGTSSGTFDARTLSIAGSGIVGVAASNSGWVISATSSQSVQAGSVYASSNTFGTSSGTYDARTLSVAGSGAVSVAASNSGWVISAPAATNLSVGASTGGNTAGDTTVATGSRLVFAGGNNITVSQGTAAGATTLTISGANVGGAQTGISGIVGSNATYTSGTVTFTGVGGGVTVSSNTGQRIDISVAAPVAQTNQAGSVYASSNTFGTSSGTFDARTLSIAGSGAVSVAASNSGWVISAPVAVAQTNETGTVYAASNTFGTSSGTYDVRTLSIAGDGIVSVAASNSGWRISATQSTQLGSVYASSNTFGTSSGTYNAKTLSIAGSGAVSVAASNSGWVISAPSQTNQAGSVYASSNTFGTSSGTFDARTLSIAGSGAVSVAASNSGWVISAPVAVAQTNQAGSVYAISNTQGTSSGTYDARTLSIAGEGIVTVAASNSGWRISASQSTQLGSVYASSNTFGTSSGTYNAKTLSLAGSGGAQIAASNSGWVVSAPVMTVSGNSTSAGAGYIALSSGTVALAGGPNVTLSQNGNTVSISAPTPGAASFSVGVSTGGNTTGNTGVTGTRIVFVGTNNITLSQATDATGATISISGGAGGGFSAGASTGGNTAGSTGITGSQLVLVGSSPISLSQSTGANGGTVSINAPQTSSLSATGAVSISTNGSTISIGAPIVLLNDWENMPMGEASLISHVSGFSKTPIYWHDLIGGNVTANSAAIKISMVTASQPLSVSIHLGVYTFVNSTSANLLGSVSEAFNVSSDSSVSLSGIRHLVITGIGTHTALSNISRGEYMLGMMFSATATNAMNFSLMGASGGAGPLGMIYPGTNQLSTGTSQGVQALWGRGSTTVNAMPAAVSAADLRNLGSGASNQLHPWIYIRS